MIKCHAERINVALNVVVNQLTDFGIFRSFNTLNKSVNVTLHILIHQKDFLITYPKWGNRVICIQCELIVK